MNQTTSFHKMYTPEALAASRRRPGGGVVPNIAVPGSSEMHFPALEIVDALSYYYDNSLNIEIPAGSSDASHIIGWESCSTWRLLIEIFRMEALADRLREQIEDETDNSLGNVFVQSANFRRLLAVLRWAHWVNAEDARRVIPKGNPVRPSKSAYPTSNSKQGEFPLDTAIRQPEKLYTADLSREQQLCKEVWALLTQGKVMESVDLCVSAGHRWRGAVLHASSGHGFMHEDSQDEVAPDWAESCIMAPLFGIESGLENDSGLARFQVKKTACEILRESSKYHGIDEVDAAITAFLCGDEAIMRSAIDASGSSNVNFWVSIHCLKEEFVAFLLGYEDMGDNRFTHVKGEELDSALGEAISSSLSSSELNSSTNQIKKLQFDLIMGDFSSVVRTMHDWVEDGICVIENSEIDVDLSSPGVDLSSLVLLRSLAASLVTVLRDLIAKDRQFDSQVISSIIVGNVECIVAQLKGSGNLNAENNQIIVDSLSLLTDMEVRVNAWAWYLRQHSGEVSQWTAESFVLFAPILSLVESFPTGALRVVKLLIRNSIERKSQAVLLHAFGTSIDAGREIAFAIGCANSVWLIAQSAAKSTGSGIYLEIHNNSQCEDPDEAVAAIVSSLGDAIGEGSLVLVLADLQAARLSLSLFQSVSFSPSGHKLMALAAALESLNEDKAEHDTFGVVSLAVEILDRASAVMERNSLLEQQRANLSQLNARNPDSRLQPLTSTDTRRRIIEAQRMMESSSDLILKLVDEIIASLGDLLKAPEAPVDPCTSHLGLHAEPWRNLVSSFFDALFESCVQAIALVDDRKRHEALLKSLRTSKWIGGVLGAERISMILEEIN